jgi:hypothetical protein
MFANKIKKRDQNSFCWDDQTNKVDGAVECRIHAENKSEVVIFTIPVHINVIEQSAYEKAQSVVDLLVDSGFGVAIEDLGDIQ